MVVEIVWKDILLILFTGLVGGFVHDALQGSFSMWNMDNTVTPHVFKPGFLGDILVGASAAFVTYGSTIATATSTTTMQLVMLGFTSGIGGSAILMSYENGNKITKYEERLKHVRV